MSERRDLPRREKNGVVQIYTRSAWRTAHVGECWYCGKPFYFIPHRHDRGRYCSSACVGKSVSKHYSRLRVKKHCVICNSVYEVAPNKAPRYKTCGRKYCQLTLRRRQAFERHKEKGFGDLLKDREGKFIGDI